MGVELSGAAVSVAEHDSNSADRAALFHQMRRERVSQGMRRHTLGEAGIASGNLHCVLHGRRAQGTRSIVLVGEEQSLRMSGAPPLAEQLQSGRRQGCETVLMSLALTNTEQHAGRVDVVDTEPADLAQTNAGGVEDREHDPVTKRADGGEEGHDLVNRENDRQVTLAMTVGDALDQVGTIEDIQGVGSPISRHCQYGRANPMRRLAAAIDGVSLSVA